MRVLLVLLCTVVTVVAQADATFEVASLKLTGGYNALLKWTPALRADTPPADAVSIFTGVQEQLGLKLEAERRRSTWSSSIASSGPVRIEGST